MGLIESLDDFALENFCQGIDKTCDHCGEPSEVYWHGFSGGDFELCRECAEYIIPALLSDLVLLHLEDKDEIERQVIFQYLRLLRKGNNDSA